MCIKTSLKLISDLDIFLKMCNKSLWFDVVFLKSTNKQKTKNFKQSNTEFYKQRTFTFTKTFHKQHEYAYIYKERERESR